MSLAQLAQQIDATVAGDATAQVTGCAPIDQAQPHHITFLANKKYQKFLETTKAAAVIVDAKMSCPSHVSRLIADDPYFAFRNAVVALTGFREHPKPVEADANGISAHAQVHPEATIGGDVVIHPYAVVEQGATIGKRCVLYPGAYVGRESVLGEECVLYPNAVIYERCILGDRVAVHSNTVIGQDGFGYATHGGVHHKIPQTGRVVIEDDVEFGAGCAIERAAMGETRIGKGTKFADLIAIGHGTTVGSHCLFVSMVGVSGSVDVGNYVVLGGQVGVTGHLKIGDRVQAAGKTAIVQNVPPGKKVGGVPAVDFDQSKRNALVGMDLYGMAQRIKKLERELAQLKREQDAPEQTPKGATV